MIVIIVPVVVEMSVRYDYYWRQRPHNYSRRRRHNHRGADYDHLRKRFYIGS